MISIRITSLYGSQPSSVVYACKTATLGPESQASMGPTPHLWFFAFKTVPLAPELQVSVGPSPHLLFCACKTKWLASELLVSMCPRPHLSFCACKTTWLASELLVPMVPSPHLWFLQAKERLVDQNYKSQASQTSPVCFCIQNSAFSTRIASLYGSQPSSVVFACKTAPFVSELQGSMCPRLCLFVCEC